MQQEYSHLCKVIVAKLTILKPFYNHYHTIEVFTLRGLTSVIHKRIPPGLRDQIHKRIPPGKRDQIHKRIPPGEGTKYTNEYLQGKGPSTQTNTSWGRDQVNKRIPPGEGTK